MTGEEEPSTDRSSFLRFGRKMSRNEKRVVIHRKMGYNSIALSVPVAQLDRVSDSDSEGCRFDPCRARHFYLETMMRRNDREVTDEQQILDVMDRCDSVYLAMQDPYCFVPYMVALSYGMEKNTEGIFYIFTVR